MANTEILLESGTNEIEIMEFTIYDELYGINVAKVREIMMTDKIKPVPHSHDAVEGIFKPRDIMLTVVDLPYYLTGQKQNRSRKIYLWSPTSTRCILLSGYIRWWEYREFPGQI